MKIKGVKDIAVSMEKQLSTSINFEYIPVNWKCTVMYNLLCKMVIMNQSGIIISKHLQIKMCFTGIINAT